jgi:hypothetical protein
MDERPDCSRMELATADAKPTRRARGCLEDIVGHGDGGLHAARMT